MTITASTTLVTNVGSHLRRRARMSPDLEAIVDVAAGRRYTFTDLHRRATQVAAALQGLGLAPGDRVAILAANGHQFAETFYGAALAGMVVVPLDWRLVAGELAFILRHSGASAVCFSRDFDALADELHDNPMGEPSTVGHPQLPVPIPVPLGRGQPSPALPRPSSVYRWIEGEPLHRDHLDDTVALAADLAGFLGALYACTPAGPRPGAHSFQRGGPVAVWNDHVEANRRVLADEIDVAAVREVWPAAIVARHQMQPIWVHGDVTGTNLLVREGRLAAVIDFGCSAYGDPACDLTIAWTFLAGAARDHFMARVPVEPSAWARARGWALWKALNHLVQEQSEPGRGRRADVRMGWRLHAADVLHEVIADHPGISRASPHSAL